MISLLSVGLSSGTEGGCTNAGCVATLRGVLASARQLERCNVADSGGERHLPRIKLWQIQVNGTAMDQADPLVIAAAVLSWAGRKAPWAWQGPNRHLVARRFIVS